MLLLLWLLLLWRWWWLYVASVVVVVLVVAVVVCCCCCCCCCRCRCSGDGAGSVLLLLLLWLLMLLLLFGSHRMRSLCLLAAAASATKVEGKGVAEEAPRPATSSPSWRGDRSVRLLSPWCHNSTTCWRRWSSTWAPCAPAQYAKCTDSSTRIFVFFARILDEIYHSKSYCLSFTRECVWPGRRRMKDNTENPSPFPSTLCKQVFEPRWEAAGKQQAKAAHKS